MPMETARRRHILLILPPILAIAPDPPHRADLKADVVLALSQRKGKRGGMIKETIVKLRRAVGVSDVEHFHRAKMVPANLFSFAEEHQAVVRDIIAPQSNRHIIRVMRIGFQGEP